MPRPKVRGVKAGTWMMATSIDENALCALLIGVEGALHDAMDPEKQRVNGRERARHVHCVALVGVKQQQLKKDIAWYRPKRVNVK